MLARATGDQDAGGCSAASKPPCPLSLVPKKAPSVPRSPAFPPSLPVQGKPRGLGLSWPRGTFPVVRATSLLWDGWAAGTWT